ncbi:hypothetical protein XH99_20460 [Bradyrhizobium nanningense]|uniref:Uncharacterized protein n=1 Tax=Bradyrhizobium nanningense TaxID=1325118 RepID=A0A4Q0S1G8_9BRAD|nr:hypothetical protein [Bradyrhizobium nanningense]RXH26315.1 hypothetical protein XH99_20460 [Bradyrhizobium nanningense]RXH29549.1 hypothetical protein XH84_21270 [Bradyrhizobium nanningense]
MSRIPILKRSTRKAIAALVLVGLLSPANATYPASVFPDLPIGTTADHPDATAAVAAPRSMVLTSHLPWLAPVGHRQPRRADVSPAEAIAASERQQQRLDQELDRKLIICRGC